VQYTSMTAKRCESECLFIKSFDNLIMHLFYINIKLARFLAAYIK